MRKILILILLPLLLVPFGYAAWPAWSAWQLRAAVKARDVAGIERRVDWTTLRSNLKQTIAANLKDEEKRPGSGFLGAVKRTVGTFVADRVIDMGVTPRTLAHILAGHLLMRDVVPAAPGPEDEAAADEADPLSPRRLRWAFFESPTRFRIEVADRTEPAKRVVSIFALQGGSWRLVDVYYRTLA